MSNVMMHREGKGREGAGGELRKAEGEGIYDVILLMNWRSPRRAKKNTVHNFRCKPVLPGGLMA